MAGKTDPVGPGGSDIAPSCLIAFGGSTLLGGTGTIPEDPDTGMGSASVTIDPEESVVEGTFGNSASAVLKDKTLTWTRDELGNWSCATTANEQYAPPGCPGVSD